MLRSNGRFSRRGQDGWGSQRRGSVKYSTVKYNDKIWLYKDALHCVVICLKANGEIDCHHRVSPILLTEGCWKLISTDSAGVIGLDDAFLLAERCYGSHITIVAEYLPGDTSLNYTSPWCTDISHCLICLLIDCSDQGYSKLLCHLRW